MTRAQPAIFEPVPRHGRYLTFDRRSGADVQASLQTLAASELIAGAVVGLGPSLVQQLGHAVDGLRGASPHVTEGARVPATPADLWCWLRSEDPGELVHQHRRLAAILEPAFELISVVDGFRHREGRDLTGYEDGTENPTGDDATTAALAGDGSSFVAVQRWRHDFAAFEAHDEPTRDAMIGRRIRDNEEIDDAPESAHVKRTAQESFEPEAFLLRRSMPYADGAEAGLMFVAFGKSFDAFEAQLARMVGHEDGVVDALFSFTRPLTSAYFWCPPSDGGRLDLSAIGL